MSRLSPFQIVALCVGLALGGAILYLVWQATNQLSQEAVTLGLGAFFTLAIVVVTGLLFIIYTVIQSRLRRLESVQDDFDELKKMQMLIGFGGQVNYHVKQAQLPGPTNLNPSPYSDWSRQLSEGEYRDTTLDFE